MASKEAGTPFLADLPEAFQGKKLEATSDLRDLVSSNPILDLCLRLSVGPCVNGKVVDPKGQLTGSVRLYHMIGKMISRGSFKRLCLLSSHQWETIENAWVATMHTVLLNKDFNPCIADPELYHSILKFKVWFLDFSLHGRIYNNYVILTNLSKLLKSLKCIAGWLQYYMTSDCRHLNQRPPLMSYFYDFDHEHGLIRLGWMGGHLSKWRSIGRKTNLSDDEIACLAQIRTFGRALPCPTSEMVEESLREQVEILCTPVQTEEHVLLAAKEAAHQLGVQLRVEEMPFFSHISVSTSGCYEQPQRSGGAAREAAEWVQGMSTPINLVCVETDEGSSEFLEFLCSHCSANSPVDVYGERVFPRTVGYYGCLEESSPLINLLYVDRGATRRQKYCKDVAGEELLPSTTGSSLLLAATGKALGQGQFLDKDGSPCKPDYWLKCGAIRLPLFDPTRFKFNLCYEVLSPPKVTLTSLAEPGAKCRPLGKNQLWFNITEKVMRFMVEPILARDGRARIGLNSTNKMWDFLKFLGKSNFEFSEAFCQSTDYKSATDLIPLDLLQALWTGFLGNLPRRHPFRVFESLLYATRDLSISSEFPEFRKEFLNSGKSHRRGSFMGEPMSFMTLTLMNLVIEVLTLKATAFKTQLFVLGNQLPPGPPVCICGDDVAAVRHRLEPIQLFKEVVAAFSGQLSWKDVISKRILIFCEDHVLVQYKDGKAKFLYIDVIKSRLLTTMSRQHTENRSAILGKGRMLRNQLDYFEDKNLQIAIMLYFHRIFDRAYKGALTKVKLPLFLPPNCGGAGIPNHDSLVNEWEYPYIGYVFSVLDIEDYNRRLVCLEELASLNGSIKHGIESKERIFILEQEATSYLVASQIDFAKNQIYSDKVLKDFLRELEIDIPVSPYTGDVKFSELLNAAAQLHFRPLSQLGDEIERTLNFNKFLTCPGVERQQRTFNTWKVRADRFFKRKILLSGNYHYYKNLGKERFKGYRDLETKVARSISGWIYTGPSSGLNFQNSGPSLRVHFSRLPVDTRPILVYDGFSHIMS